MAEVPPLPPEVADLARRIHYGQSPVVPPADVVFRLARAGHQATLAQVVEAITRRPGRAP